MSLLLEALKKAEKAKEEAQRQAQASAAPERAELQLQGEAATAPEAERKPVITRDQLPEISTPLEIVSDDLKPAAAPEAEPIEAPRRRRGAEASMASPEAADRATARKVFEAKFREPNPRLPFYIAMASLGAFAVGTAVYFYIQLRPPPTLVNANPPRPSSEAATPAVAGAQPAVTSPSLSGSAAIPRMPAAPSLATPPPASPAPALAAAPRRAVPEMAPERPRLKPQPERVRPAPLAAESAPAAAPAAPVRAEPQVNPKVEAGYAAYLAGDAAAARKEYQQALSDDPANRDALLGVAALDVRAGRYELAEAAYLRLLQANPRDTAAHAGLVALRSGRIDPLVAESRLKSLLLADPAAHPLNFALGNLYAQQGRWAEAQQEFFKAVNAESDNADYAYNLAVSLDQLHQPRLARVHYQRAVSLGEKRGASFDLAAARARLAQLTR
jgi:Flp pilus assembly protein TadD